MLRRTVPSIRTYSSSSRVVLPMPHIPLPLRPQTPTNAHDAHPGPPPKAAEALWTAGNELFKKGKYRDAERKYTTVLESVAPNSAVLYCQRSQARLRAGRGKDALADARKATELAPEWSQAHLRLAEAFATLGRQKEAQKALADAMRYQPESGEPTLEAIKRIAAGEFPGPKQSQSTAVMDASKKLQRPSGQPRAGANDTVGFWARVVQKERKRLAADSSANDRFSCCLRVLLPFGQTRNNRTARGTGTRRSRPRPPSA